ncbi:hypothetical protein NL533_31770, partial [Klebsiella pneumoniae]|nr:hypothetical protein [Klebsiella pneumoniae]
LIATGTNSIFTFNGGTLTTLGGSEIRAGASLFTGALGLQVGSGATAANWSMLGGSNKVLANNLYVGMNSDNRILVSGPSTTFDFSGSI